MPWSPPASPLFCSSPAKQVERACILAGNGPPDPRQVRWLDRLARLRTVASAIGLGLTLGYVVIVLAPIDLAHLPSGFEFIAWLYRPYL